MEWWDALGAYAMQLNPAPALAVDMMAHGPQHSDLGHALADRVQRTPVPIDVYGDGGQ